MATPFLLVSLALAMLLGADPAGAALIAHWEAEGNADDSVGPNAGVLVNGVGFGAGVFGQAFHFDGSSYVEAPTFGFPTGNQDRTLHLWFNVDSYSSTVEEAFLAGYGTFGSFGGVYAVLVNHFNIFGPAGDRVAFSQWGQGIIGGPAIRPGTWHALGVTNVGDFATLYLDGVAVASGTLAILTPTNTSFVVGRVPGPLGGIRQLDGLVDDVRLYDTALSAQEMQALAMVVPEPTADLLLVAGLVAALQRVSRASRTPGRSAPG